MFDMNWFMGMIKQGYNPRASYDECARSFVWKVTPMGDNLISMARSGNKAGIEQVARNMMAQRGLDFDKEFNAFRQRYGL